LKEIISSKKHETSNVLKTRELEMEYLKDQGCHHIVLYITQLGIDVKELLPGPGDQRMNNAVWRKISHLDDPVGIASVITRSLGEAAVFKVKREHWANSKIQRACYSHSVQEIQEKERRMGL
jgi:hypothetical protein